METTLVNEQIPCGELANANESELHLMGGKAATLSHLLKKNFPVPEGLVLFREPKTPTEFQQVIHWWEKSGAYPVAVRSSASGEDSADFSYAGQFVTLININSKNDLIAAIKTCFEAVNRKSSQSYASHFERAEIPMHVLVQRMIQSKFSGVFFSQDPRDEKSSWLVEVVRGQGEQLVSGQVNPYRFIPSENSKQQQQQSFPEEWKQEYLETIVHWGKKVEAFFDYKVDMEWAIDQEGNFWILQSRPITAHGSQSSRQKVVEAELQRILKTYPADSIWDGHTFAEWTGVPTELTYDLWQKTFQANHAFDLALKQIGYQGLQQEHSEATLLDRIFGRAYLNLKSMEAVYFGKAPYQLEPNPRPHLKFNWKKLSPSVLLRAPVGIFRMGLVAWNIQTGRHELAQKALAIAKGNLSADKNAFALHAQGEFGLEQLQDKLSVLVNEFSKTAMQSTFLMTLLIESTTQGLLALIEKDLGVEKATEAIGYLTGSGLQTVAVQMHQAFSSIEGSTEKWNDFLSRYGHRGVGELELSHPRWIETSMPLFKHAKTARVVNGSESQNVLDEVATKLSSLRLPIFRQELRELQQLLEIREDIKMETMKLYAQIRWMVLSIGELAELGSDIFWLNFNEILSMKPMQIKQTDVLRSKAQDRKKLAHHLKSIDLPMIFSMNELKGSFDNPVSSGNSAVIAGVSLSPGIASGIVHIVTDPEKEDLDSWPENYILVAEATDPGWTPLFERARAVIVARGGVLSHCAIVAREMNLPAVGEIRGVSHLLKEGERVWVDGNHGTIRRSN